MNIIERLEAWVKKNLHYLRYAPRIMGFAHLFIGLAKINHGDEHSFEDMRIEDGELIWEGMFNENENQISTAGGNLILVAQGLYLALALNEDELTDLANWWLPRCKNEAPLARRELKELEELFRCVPSVSVIADSVILAIGDKRFVWHSDENFSPRTYATLCKLAKDSSGELHNPIFVQFIEDVVEIY